MTQRVWLSEFSNIGGQFAADRLAQIAALPSLVDQQKDVTGGAQTFTLGSKTSMVRIVSEVQIALASGNSALTTNLLLPALAPEYFAVTPSSTLTVIAAP
jgi:hypothetical protein